MNSWYGEPNYDAQWEEYAAHKMEESERNYRNDPLRYFEQFLTDEPITFQCACGSTRVEVEEIAPTWMYPEDVVPVVWVWDCECADCGKSWDADITGKRAEISIDDLNDVPF